MKKSIYLGDSVYVGIDEYGRIVLTTEDGIRATNTIVMESEVLSAFIMYIEAVRQESGGAP